MYTANTDTNNRNVISFLQQCVCVFQTGLSGNIMILSVLYKGGLLTASQHMTVGELSSFLLYTFWVGISIAGNMQRQAVNEQYTFPLYEYGVSVPVGLSSFYSELMKGFGAGARLWELMDRKPEFSQNGKAKKTWVIYFTLIFFYLFILICSANLCSFDF